MFLFRSHNVSFTFCVIYNVYYCGLDRETQRRQLLRWVWAGGVNAGEEKQEFKAGFARLRELGEIGENNATLCQVLQ